MFSHLPEQRAIAFQLLSALQAYEADVDLLLQGGFDEALYTRLSEQFDAMRPLAASLPQLTVGWVMLLISRAELTHALFKAERDRAAAGEVAGHHATHRTAIEELRGSCTRLAMQGARRA